MYLFTGLPRDLRTLIFKQPRFLDFEFVKGAVKYFHKLERLDFFSLDTMFLDMQDMNHRIYQMNGLRDLLK